MQKNCPVLPHPDSIQKIIVAVIWIMINSTQRRFLNSDLYYQSREYLKLCYAEKRIAEG
jgi:hypothetical protein